MAEEGVVAVPETHVPSDHKRKLEDLEGEAPEQVKSSSKEPADSNAKLDADKNDGIVSFDESDAKRLRLDDNPSSEEPVDPNVELDASRNDDIVATDGLANGNGHQEEKEDEHVKENDAQEALETKNLDEAQNQQDEAQHQQDEHKVNYEQPSADNEEIGGSQELSVENCVLVSSAGDTNEKTHLPSDEGSQQSSLNNAQQGDDVSVKEQHPTSRKMEVPNNKVGVLIGKAGDTIRYLQYNSGAKIQITRDADSDPLSATRPVEIIGTLDSISIAEKLISAVIAEADAGGSPSLVARGVNSAQAASTGDQIQIQVPNEKVGLIIGRGGETIKALQTRSGARIQLIPQHPPEGDESKERTVRVTGDRKQIETAREMIKDVMNQTLRPSPVSGGFNQPTYRSRVPAGPPQWGNRGHHMSQQTSYDYHQRGAYPSQSSQYPHYGGYHQNMGPRGGFGSGWEQRPSPSMQGIPPHGGGYDYYSGHGGRLPEGPASSQHSAPAHGHVPGPSAAPAMGPPPSQPNYNYGHSQGPDYGHTAAPYSQSGHSQQNYGHGYDEPKYDNHAPAQHPPAQHPPYGGQGGGYSQAGAQSGYGPQSQYGRPPSYGMPSQGLPSQSYGPPRPNQPGDASYQGSGATQSYGQNVPPQQPYPYASSAPAQQTYPPYGSAPTAEGYNQPTQAPVSGYPQQGGQPVASYNQSVSQQAPGYAQANATAGYAQYPSTQQGYPDQSAANAAAYGYQTQQDPNYSGTPASAYTAPPTGQQGYVQPSAQSYDQSGTYGVPTSASVGYGKTVSPQPGYAQYDSTQMYAASAPAPAQAPATH